MGNVAIEVGKPEWVEMMQRINLALGIPPVSSDLIIEFEVVSFHSLLQDGEEVAARIRAVCVQHSLYELRDSNCKACKRSFAVKGLGKKS